MKTLILRCLMALLQPLPGYSGLYGEDSPYTDADGLEPGEIVPGRPFIGPSIEWPKVSWYHSCISFV